MKRSFPAITAIEDQTQYKFFFLDEDQEFISISSQEDFNDNREYILVSPEAQQSIPALIYSDNQTEVSKHFFLAHSKIAVDFNESEISCSDSQQNRMMKALTKKMKQRLVSEQDDSQ